MVLSRDKIARELLDCRSSRSSDLSVRDSSGTPDGGWRVGWGKQKVTERNLVLDHRTLAKQQRSKTNSPVNSSIIRRFEIGDSKLGCSSNVNLFLTLVNCSFSYLIYREVKIHLLRGGLNSITSLFR